MTIQETYDFLWQVRKLDNAIHRLQMKKKELESCLLPSAIRYDKDTVQRSPEDITGRIVAEIDRIDRRIEKLTREKAKRIDEIDNAIEMIQDDNEKTVLNAFFVGRLQMSQVAEYMHYSIRMAYYIRKRGVASLGKILG